MAPQESSGLEVLVNCVRDGVGGSLDAAPVGAGGGVTIAWRATSEWLEVEIDDDGKGLPDTSNLFVPFFTTKPNGSGIGLALSRQIAEAHGGTLTLENRTGTPGCRALLRIPVGAR